LNLRNQELVELISSAVRDLAEAEFVGDRDAQNNPLPSKPILDVEPPQKGFSFLCWSYSVFVTLVLFFK